jgi:hypothetical protein
MCRTKVERNKWDDFITERHSNLQKWKEVVLAEKGNEWWVEGTDYKLYIQTHSPPKQCPKAQLHGDSLQAVKDKTQDPSMAWRSLVL